jgi:hypothetical protein
MDPDLSGEKCSVLGDWVDGLDTCDKGLICWDPDADTKVGTCIDLCKGRPRTPECPPGHWCAVLGDGILALCLPWCDPLAQDCGPEELCLPSGDEFDCFLDMSENDGEYGDPCEYANACDPGLLCLNPEYVPDCPGNGCCSPFCDVTAPNTCPGDGQVCIPWFEEGMSPPGYENVGFCGVPQP